MQPLAIEHQTVLGLPPVELVRLAAEFDCRYIAIGLTGGAINPHGYAPYSLRDDVALRRRMIEVLHECQVSISLGEGFVVRAGTDVRSFAADMDVMAELGAQRINTVSMDPDLGRSFDAFAEVAELAAARGLETTLEFAPSLSVSNLDLALAAIRHVARADFRLLIDVMHFVRAGHSVLELAAIDPRLIAYVQLSDNTLQQRGASYRDDSLERMPPGEGELPLREIMAVLPPRVVIGLEIPMRSRAAAGESTRSRVRRCVHAARELLAKGA